MVTIEDFLKETSKEFESAVLPIPLGVDRDKKYVMGDLVNLGNILIAGSTGSGKSVFNHSVIYSLTQKYLPHHLKFFLADPKIVDMTVYQDINYLFSKIETEPEKIFEGMEKLIEEKTRRLEDSIDVPYIIAILDTFSDLAVADIARLERLVQGITEHGEKTGIHLIMCDSRPSIDVYTEKIKSCFQTKIAFNTASDDDSEVILGQIGAEWLLGKGDMLLLEEGKKPVRLQAPWISDEIIQTAVYANKIQ